MRKLQIAYNDWMFDVYYVTEVDEIKKCIKSCMKYDMLGLDIETGKVSAYADHKKSGLCPHISQIRLIQIYGGDNRIFVFDVWDLDITMFKELLQSKKLVAHNAVFEMKFFKHFGVDISHCKCTQIMTDLVWKAEQEETYDSPGLKLGLANVSAVELGYQIPKDQQISNWNSAELSIQQIQYAALDAVLPIKIVEKMLPRLKSFKLGRSFNVICRAQNAVVDMELTGVGFDAEGHAKFIADCEKKLEDAEAEALAAMSGVTNLASTSQLSKWAGENLDKKTLEKFDVTKTGLYSFNAKKLKSLGHISAIQKYQEYKTMQGWTTKFGQRMSEHQHPLTGNIHPSFWLTGIATGRMSSSNINFQQIPRDTAFRKLFIANPGRKLIGADYSSVETRIQAECSRDPVMLEAYAEGKDLYLVMAGNVFNKPYDEIYRDYKLEDDSEAYKQAKFYRQIAKALVLALGYGMGAKKFKSTVFEQSGLNLSEVEAYNYWDSYHQIFKKYSKWCDKMRLVCEKTGYAQTMCGRLRKLHPDNIYTKAPNHVIQGTAAQIMLYAMADLVEKKLPGFHIVAVIHDELLCEVDETKADDYARELEDSMIKGFLEVFPNGVIRGLVDAQIGDSWGDVH